MNVEKLTFEICVCNGYELKLFIEYFSVGLKYSRV